MLKNTDFPIDERGRVRVSADLRVTGDDGVVEGAWAAGDNAAVPDLSGGGVGGFCVPNAQHASRQAVVLAKNLLAARRGEPLTDYYHETIGVVAGLGLWKGVANFKGKTIGGPLAWIMPVSYTHLDVYKRQVLPGAPGHHRRRIPPGGWRPHVRDDRLAG